MQVINSYPRVTDLLGEKTVVVDIILKMFHVYSRTYYILILHISCSYEFVKYLRQYIKNTVGPVIEEETEKCTCAQNQGEISGYDTLVQHLTKKARESKE